MMYGTVGPVRPLRAVWGAYRVAGEVFYMIVWVWFMFVTVEWAFWKTVGVLTKGGVFGR